ncbi:MAG: aspartate aminotransferase family protein [Huintestinicola sp.]|uniref:aspartate aminotransferase family protein n=1 Tax=Huintestinicola sp. TaxID=2981661 RepID=UPI003EFDF8FF
MSTIEKFNEHVMQTYGRLPIVLEKGKGREAVDENGKEYIDFGSGIGTNSLGYCDEKWADAVCAQVRSIQHTSNYFYTKVQADFAERLCAVTGYKNVFFGNSGAEANECAIKLARKYSFDKYGKGRHTIVTLVNSFHGRTIATLSATGQEVFHNYFFPFVEGFVNVPANDIEALRKLISEDKTICAVMFEFVQGEGGVNPLDKAFVEEIFRLCGENDILTVADEVQTGVGRTGTFLASEQYGIKPDITSLAKGIAGGVPMGACLASEKCADVLVKGTHGSTFGGNPIACAGANAVLDRVTENGFLEDVMKKSEYFKKKLAEIPEVEGVDGLGLMLGVRLKTKKAGDILTAAAEKGLLILTAKEKLRFLPPLTITYEEIDKGMEILTELLK